MRKALTRAGLVLAAAAAIADPSASLASAGHHPPADMVSLQGFASTGDALGFAIDVRGDWMAVGAPGANRVHMYKHADGTWTETEPIDFNQTGFGSAVSLGGSHLVVGSIDRADVFIRNGEAWTWEQELEPPIDQPASTYGHQVAIDGNVAVIGQRTSLQWKRLFVFTKDAGTWTRSAALEQEGTDQEFGFGADVAVRGDTIVIGADGRLGTGDDAPGFIQIHERDGDDWPVAAQLLTGSAAQPGTSDGYGRSVSISGNKVAVGAPGARSVYIVKRQGSSWVEQTRIHRPAWAGFGGDVDLSNDDLMATQQASPAALLRNTEGVWEDVGAFTPVLGDPTRVATHQGTYVANGMGGLDSRVDVLGLPCSAVAFAPGTLALSGGAQTTSVSAQVLPEGCSWFTSDNRNWISTAPLPRTRSATVDITVSAGGLQARVGRVFGAPLGGAAVAEVSVEQASGITPCSSVLLDRYSETVTSSATSFQVGVTEPDATCGWTAQANDAWLEATRVSTAKGDAVRIDVAVWTGAGSRTGTVTIGTRTFTVIQGYELSCGVTLHADTVLDGSLDCTGLGANEVGLVLTNGVTLDLNGYDILGPGLGVVGAVGVLLEGVAASVLGGPGTMGSVVDFDFGLAAIEPESFPCPSFGSISDGSCFARTIAGTPQRALKKADAVVNGVRFEGNNFGVFGIASDIDVKDSTFLNNTEGVTHYGASATAPNPKILVRTSHFMGNYVGMDLETAGDVRVLDNVFTENTGAGALLIETDFTRVVGNRFTRNNSDTDGGKFLGQLTLRPTSSDVIIQCNVFVDDPYDAADALALGPGERPGHGGIGISDELSGAVVQIIENEFRRGDVGVFFYGAAGSADFIIDRNDFFAPLSFNVGIHDGFVSPRRLSGSDNYVADGSPAVSDPSNSGYDSNTVTAGAANANGCSLRLRER